MITYSSEWYGKKWDSEGYVYKHFFTINESMSEIVMKSDCNNRVKREGKYIFLPCETARKLGFNDTRYNIAFYVK